MNLKKGLHIYSDITTITQQLLINSGTQPATIIKEYNYARGAYIPKRDWRKLSLKEQKVLFNCKHTNYYNTLYVSEVPISLKKQLELLNLKECKKLEEIYPKLKENKELLKRVNDKLHHFFDSLSTNRNYKFHRITRTLPKRETITCFYIDEAFLYIGLHIDQSKHFSIHTAYKSGNRISINLSNESRFLLVVNLTLIQTFNLLKKKIDVVKAKINPDNMYHHFFKHYPEYPVLKIELKPYQYYVAPTDNFFHDASTLGNKELDITLVYTGEFDMPQTYK